MSELRIPRRVVQLTRILIWCWVLIAASLSLFYLGDRPPTIIAISIAVSVIGMGMLSLTGLVIHGVPRRTWQFSVRALLIAMTLVAVALGLIVSLR